MKGFIKISNNIFQKYKLKPKALFVYIYLCGRVNCLQYTSATYEKIACACSMTAKTAASAVDELIALGLIAKQNRYNARGYIANRYYVKNLISNNKFWFKVEREVFGTNIKAADFMVYCFIRACMDSKQCEGFPSLSCICEYTGMSRSRVCKAVQYLKQYTFINRVKRHYKRTRAWRHNRYLLFKCNILRFRKTDKKVACTVNSTSQNFSQGYNILHFDKCQAFFINQGSIHFTKHSLDPQLLSIKR